MADIGKVEKIVSDSSSGGPTFAGGIQTPSGQLASQREDGLGGMREGFDEESPLAEPREEACSDRGAANGGSGGDPTSSPPPTPEVLSNAELPRMRLPQEGGSHSGATPLIILPVQSEGIPTSGAFPLGRGNPTPPAAFPDLKKVLSQQLEYYFSKENLSQDKFLRSQMDAANYVPVSVISNFNQVKKLTTDMALILEVIRESSVLQLDEREDKVRAIPEKRCVLILREIPQDTPKSDIEALFDHEKCPNCVTCEFADNNCWYVTFESEESTQLAFTYLREQVREFLGQPIRARIKGTTVQRSSGMPKNKHVPFSMPPVYNGAAPQMPSYYPPPAGMPWSPTPPTSSTSPYFDPSNFPPYSGVGNGFATPPQPPQQPQPPTPSVGVAGQSSAAGVQHYSNNNGRFPSGGFPYNMHLMRGEDRGGRGRMNLPNRPRVGERGQSPPNVPPESELPVPPLERDKLDHKSGRGGRDQHGGGTGGGAGSGNRFRHTPEERKLAPRLKNPRHGGRGVEGGGQDKTQLPPRQQNKPQPKLDLATAHFPPLPTSSSSENGTTPSSAPPTMAHSHISVEAENPKTLSEIVRRSLGKETGGAGGSTPSGSAGGVASSMVEKTLASATAKVSSSTGPTPSSDTPTSQPSVNSDPIVSDRKSGEGGEEVSVGAAVVTTARVVTASSVVASGGGGNPSHYQQQSTGNSGTGSRPPPPPPVPATSKAQKSDSKTSGKDRTFNSGGNKQYTRGYNTDREINSSKQNRNSQVQKSDGRSAPSNARGGRFKDRDYFPSASSRGGPQGTGGMRPPNGGGGNTGGGPRQSHSKSPKTFKKNFPPHSPQAPPPPPTPSSSASDPTPETLQSGSGSKTETTSSSSSSHSQSASSAKPPEKLSYAQMAQKKNNQKTANQDSFSSAGGEGGAKTSSPPISPQAVTTPTVPPPQSTTSKAIKSTSTGSLTAGQGQGSTSATSKSAPTSPTKELGGMAGGSAKSKENEV